LAFANYLILNYLRQKKFFKYSGGGGLNHGGDFLVYLINIKKSHFSGFSNYIQITAKWRRMAAAFVTIRRGRSFALIRLYCSGTKAAA